MADSLQIRNQSQMLRSRLEQLFGELMSEYRQGKIKSITELHYRSYMLLRDLYESYGSPGMQIREAMGTPSSADFNATLQEIAVDLNNIFEESNIIAKAIQSSFTRVEIERQALGNRLKKLNDKVKMLSYVLYQSQEKTHFRDSFLSQQLYDRGMVEGEPASVNVREAALTLAKLDSEEYSQDMSVSIISGNGFPGNTHQINIIGGTLKFVGENNAHIDLRNMTDNNTDTWFEYELYNISDAVRQETAGLNFEYKENISWLQNQNEPLKLQLLFELPSAKVLNWLSLTPFIPSERGTAPVVITEIIIDDGKGIRQQISNNDVLNENKVYLFSRQKCKYIHISIEQPVAYETLIGHIYFQEIQGSQTNFLGIRPLPGKRVDGPRPSIESLGFKFDPLNRTLTYPTSNTLLPSQLEIVKNLFTIPETTNDIQADTEVLPAMRYHIGLKNIASASYRFVEESTYISHPFKTISPISEIELITAEYIPDEFGTGEWTSYYISVDDGATWLPINPQGSRLLSGKRQYFINSGTPAEARRDNTGYIETLTPVYEVRVKIDISRPTDIKDADFYSPIIKEYILVVAEKRE